MRRLMPVVAFAVAGAAAFAVAAALAAGGSSSTGRTIRLLEQGGTSTEIDNPPKGNRVTHLISAGNFSTGTVKLGDESGKPAGTLHLVCVATIAGTDLSSRFQCTGTVRLARGTLALSALSGLSSTPGAKQIAVVGGTGAYEGARGSMTSGARSTGEIADVIHLRP
jgi:hypothetical protein